MPTTVDLECIANAMPTAQQRARVRSLAGRITVGQLRTMSEAEMAAVRFIGPMTARSIKRFMQANP